MAFRLKLVPDVTTFDFFKHQRITFGASVVMVIAALVLWLVMGLNFGIDFQGGILLEILIFAGADNQARRIGLAGDHQRVVDGALGGGVGHGLCLLTETCKMGRERAQRLEFFWRKPDARWRNRWSFFRPLSTPYELHDLQPVPLGEDGHGMLGLRHDLPIALHRHPARIASCLAGYPVDKLRNRRAGGDLQRLTVQRDLHP